MGKITVGEEASTPAAPNAGFTFFSTLATPTVPSLITKAGLVGLLALLKDVGSWTPGVSFGGGTTGITYSVRVGNYIRVAEWVLFWGYFRLSNKGSSTGNALITGLPVAARTLTNLFIPMSLMGDDLTSISGHLQGAIASAAQTISLSHLGTGADTALTHANFGNTSLIRVAGLYEVA